MVNFFKKILLISIIIFVILIDLPENLVINFKLFNRQFKTVINPLTIDIKIFNLNLKKKFETKLGLDLKGGSHLVFQADTNKLRSEDVNDAINGARDIIEKRVNFYGVAEPVVQTIKSGNNYRIIVDLPGISDSQQAINLIGRTAQLKFKEEIEIKDPKIATTTAIIDRLIKDTGMTGKDIKKATLDFNNQTGKPEVALEFTDQGKKLFAEITKRNINKPLAIWLDNMLLSAPIVQTEIKDGRAVISGNFTVDEAKKLTISINAGVLPLPIKLIEQRQIGPSLGELEVKKSLGAGIVGLLMVVLFMFLFYGRLGLIADLALIIYGLISLAIFRAIPVVLTLSGIAGFILSIGMAVDSNILIFERIKEEQRKGRDFDIACRLGFGRAIDAIKDANITTLTVAFILFNPLNWSFLPQFGMVRGFALTLAIGVATSLFTGVVITKRLINFFYKVNI